MIRIASAVFLLLSSVSFSVAQEQGRPEKCPSIRALDGSCANAGLVASSEARSNAISSVRTSYAGSANQDVGLEPIPFSRLFKDDPLVFGLQTKTLTSVQTHLGAISSVTTITKTK